ncbi:MAG: EthD domain-containing protein [Pseudomonadota bacterium]
MIKVMWFLKRADHLSLEEFRSWWLDSHIDLVLSLQKDHLYKYTVSIRESDQDTLPGNTDVNFDWDGCAEQWFETEADFNAVYGNPTPSESREDSHNHVSKMARMIVRETAVVTPD